MSESKQSVDEVLDSLPKGEQVIARHLRALILACLPTATEKNSYGVPFYAHHRLICFIWPPSIYWGPKQKDYKRKGVTLGFNQGYLMANEDGALLAEDRKQVYCMYFHSAKEIKEEQIRALLFEADLIDQEFGKQKNRKKKKKR